jgi:hypothetical protein
MDVILSLFGFARVFVGLGEGILRKLLALVPRRDVWLRRVAADPKLNANTLTHRGMSLGCGGHAGQQL